MLSILLNLTCFAEVPNDLGPSNLPRKKKAKTASSNLFAIGCHSVSALMMKNLPSFPQDIENPQKTATLSLSHSKLDSFVGSASEYRCIKGTTGLTRSGGPLYLKNGSREFVVAAFSLVVYFKARRAQLQRLFQHSCHVA